MSKEISLSDYNLSKFSFYVMSHEIFAVIMKSKESKLLHYGQVVSLQIQFHFLYIFSTVRRCVTLLQ